MKIVIQRVSKASVTIHQNKVAAIQEGLLILLGIANEDTEKDIDWLVRKVSNLRIFNDAHDVMNRSLIDTNGDVLVVSQFTLHASTQKGSRPSYIRAAKPGVAIPLYQQFVASLETALKKKVQTGEFGAEMKIELLNNGPVTIVIDSKVKE